MYELLIVDDETNSRNMLATCFPWNELGFHVCGQADDGSEALNFINDNVVHVVFTDIRMPVTDGIELAKKIYGMPEPRPLVVFLSAYKDFEYAQKAIKYNVRYYALKPSSFAELTEIFTSIKDELDQHFEFSEDTSKQWGSNEIIQSVMEYLNTHYQTATLEEISQKLYLNPSYLSQVIRKETGYTFSEHLLDIRMKQASLLLQSSNTKVYYVSNMVGYSNSNNFSRAFQRYYNMSPSEYRNSKLKGT